MHLTVLGLEQKFPQIAQKISKNKNKFSGLNFLVIVKNFLKVQAPQGASKINLLNIIY